MRKKNRKKKIVRFLVKLNGNTISSNARDFKICKTRSGNSSGRLTGINRTKQDVILVDAVRLEDVSPLPEESTNSSVHGVRVITNNPIYRNVRWHIKNNVLYQNSSSNNQDIAVSAVQDGPDFPPPPKPSNQSQAKRRSLLRFKIIHTKSKWNSKIRIYKENKKGR